jgi:predicted small lipoprotein YifL
MTIYRTAALSLAILLTACGQTGPLVYPEQPSEASSAANPATTPSAAE